MKLTPAIQEAILALLFYDPSKTGAKLVRSLIPAPLFDPFYRDFAAAAYEFIDRFGVPPGEHAVDLVESLKARDEKKAEFYDRLYRSIEQTKSGVNRDYVVSQASLFARFQSLKAGIASALDALEKGSEAGIQEADAVLQKSMRVSLDLTDPGTFIHDSSKMLRFMNEDFEPFPCGIKEFDRLGLGPGRKRYHLFGAPPKRGKTWWLLHLFKMALLNGKRPLYLSLEVSEQVLSQRILMSMFGFTKRKAQDLQNATFRTDDLGRFVGFDIEKLGPRPALYGEGAEKTLRRLIDSRLKNRPRGLVKEFPSGSIGPAEVDAYLEQCEGRGFIPDLLIVDYPDLMRIADPKHHRLYLQKIGTDLRGIAQKRNLALAAATQGNRSSISARRFDEQALAEDFGKAMVCDVGIGYSQTLSEKQLGLARLFVFAGREDADRFSVVISQNYGIGQFCLDSVILRERYFKELEAISEDGENASGEDAEDAEDEP